MNKEYIRINENEMEVYDENKNKDYRNYTEQMPDVLVLENKLEYINNIVNNLKCDLSKIKELASFINLWNKVHFITIPVSLMIGIAFVFISYTATYLTYALWWSMAVGITTIFTTQYKKYAEKKRSGIEQQITEAEKIGNMWSQELIKLSMTEMKDEIAIGKKYAVPTYSFEAEDRLIKDAYTIGYKSHKNKVRARKLDRK